MICIGVASPNNEASSAWYLPGVNVRQIVLVHMVEDEERRCGRSRGDSSEFGIQPLLSAHLPRRAIHFIGAYPP